MPSIVGELVVCRVSGGRRECRFALLPGEGSGGAIPVVRIEIEGPVWWAFTLVDEADR